VVVTCNAEGSGNTGPGVDCSATGQTCIAGVCGSGVVDTVGALTGSTVSTLPISVTKVNFYSITTARTLRKIEFYMEIQAATTLYWVVYESTAQTGTYTQVSSTTTSSVPAIPQAYGYLASDAISVPLKAGYFYAIGVSWGATNQGYPYLTAPASYPIATSFGGLVNGNSVPGTNLASIPGPSSPMSYYAERLTTTP
jgi:hypothetical protein